MDALLAAGVWNGEVIFKEIQALGYSGGPRVLRQYIHPKRVLRPSKATVRFETKPGDQLQHDWGELFTEIGGVTQKIYSAVNTLGYSRRFHVVAGLSCDAEHTYESLVRSFAWFGGVSITRYLAEFSDQYLYHTNHVLAGPFAETRPASSDENSFAGPSSSRRFEAMRRFFEAHPQPDLVEIKTLLTSEDGPICAPRVTGQGFTFGACIMTLGTDPSLHITHGPPSISSFIEHGL